jgi:signal transduction histidine kinase
LSPLFTSGTPARGFIVLRLDPQDYLLPLLRQWPVPSRTAVSQLVMLEGNTVIAPERGEVARLTDENESSPFVATVLRGDAPRASAVDGHDLQGRPVLGVVQPVPGTGWFLAAQIERSEVYEGAHFDAACIAVAGLLALLATGVVLQWRHDREVLNRQRALELAAKNRALERTVMDLEAFCASVSHDLRGPLRTVNGFAAVLENTEGNKLSDEGRRRLARIRSGAGEMDRMLEDMLRCARAERADLHFGPVDLDRVVHNVVAELEPAYPASRVTVGPLPTVHADPTMVRQVFANLIGNALKFSARQAQPHVEVGTLPDNGQPRIFVRDNGVGFEGSQSDKLFEPFQRLHRDEDYEGTGVGLAIVKRVIERHGGRIAAQSQPGVRTVFTFDFGPAGAGPG